MNELLARVAELVRARSGIRIRPAQFATLEAAAARTFDADLDMALRGLTDEAGGARLLDHLIDELTVKETYFLRNAEELRLIDWQAVHGLARKRGSDQIRAWSAACATGEEAYTLALLAAEAFGMQQPPVRILGTDISRTALDTARRATYGPRSVRNVERSLVVRHFQPGAGGLSPGPGLQHVVDFAQHNLALAPGPPAGAPFDLIVCRNVLIYFDRRSAEHAFELLQAALAPGGTLLLGAADRLSLGRLGRAPVRQQRHSRRERKRPAPLRRRRSAPTVSLEKAVDLADAGDLPGAVEMASRLLAGDPMNPATLYVMGLAQLALGETHAAVQSLRAAQYADPDFALAAFSLGRAHDANGDAPGARRAYEQALRTFDPDDSPYPALFERLDVGDVATACRARLLALSGAEDTPQR